MSCCNKSGSACPKNVANGCCRNPAICPKEKSEFQQTLCDLTEKVADLKMQKRRLAQEFRKRPASKCSDFKPLSKRQFDARCEKLQNKIDSCIARINALKNARKAAQTIRDPDSFCNRGGVCCGGSVVTKKNTCSC